jgi:release factor glutamine methyltransferase
MLTIQSALEQGTRILDEAGVIAPRLTAEVLLAHAAGCERTWLYAHSTDQLREVWWIHYGRYLDERLKGKPTQYITRKQEFYGREFSVGPAVLIPRPETEHVVETSLEKMPDAPGPVVDVGCGSGAIAITLALETGRPVIGTDISPEALAVACRNGAALGAREVGFVLCDLVTAIAPRSVALLVSNPPYVPAGDKTVLQREVRDYEPDVALYGGADGLDVYRRLIADAERVLQSGGWIVMEVAYNSDAQVRDMLAYAFTDIEMRTDLAGLPRVVAARRREAA